MFTIETKVKRQKFIAQILGKKNNEDASLHFTGPSGSTSLKTEGFLHIFTKLRKPCLLVPP